MTTYHGFCDMSGGHDDDSTLGIGHLMSDDIVVVDLVMDQGPRGKTFDPNIAVKKFAEVLRRYGISEVVGDRYAGEWPRKAFETHGISYRLCDKSKSELYAGLEPLLNSGGVELLDHPTLFQQLLGLVRRGMKIDHPAGEHDDFANVVAGVVYICQQESTREPRIRFLEGRGPWLRGNRSDRPGSRHNLNIPMMDFRNWNHLTDDDED